MSKVAGADISKDWIDLCFAGEPQVVRLANTSEALARWLDEHRPAVVAFEPTGGYERTLQDAVRALAIPFVRVHPNRVIAFRKACGVKAKTDRIDAALIAGFTAHQLSHGGLKAPVLGDEILRELGARRRQVVDALHAERCRLDIARASLVRAGLERSVARLTADLEELDAALAAHVAETPALAARARLLRTLTGIGPVSAHTLMADLPELGLLSHKEIGSLAGLAPITRESGKTSYRARTGHGRPSVKQVLFNATRAAISKSGPLRDYYDRLVQHNGRPGKVALTALMHKMLTILNAMVRDGTPWAGRRKIA